MDEYLKPCRKCGGEADSGPRFIGNFQVGWETGCRKCKDMITGYCGWPKLQREVWNEQQKEASQ